ncbi:MAG: hypothetical protein ACTSWP_02055 [Candidatus Freyarchaeota archaeon]
MASPPGEAEPMKPCHDETERCRVIRFEETVKGSRLVKNGDEYYLHVTFRRTVETRRPEGLLGIDLNERSIDLAVVKPGKVEFIKIDMSEVKHVRDGCFRRRSIQSKTSGRRAGS